MLLLRTTRSLGCLPRQAAAGMVASLAAGRAVGVRAYYPNALSLSRLTRTAFVLSSLPRRRDLRGLFCGPVPRSALQARGAARPRLTARTPLRPRCARSATSLHASALPPLVMPAEDMTFREIREQDRWFHDFTRYLIKIVQLENKQAVLARMGRSGKSLLAAGLCEYVDVKNSEEDFRGIFKGTDVCKLYPDELPPRARAYHVLKMNFTLTVSRDPDVVQERLNNVVANALRRFINKYGLRDPRHADLPFPVRDNDALASMKEVIDEVHQEGGQVYVVVDEYDRFADDMMLLYPHDYLRTVREGTATSTSSPLSSFYARLKAIVQEAPGLRSFSVGLTPIALADSTGANTIMDLSRLPAFADIVGFSPAEVRATLRRVPSLSSAEQEIVFERMTLFYDGYSNYGSRTHLFHPKLCVYCFTRLIKEEGFRRLLASKDESISDLLAEMTDSNVDTSESAITFLLSQPSVAAAMDADEWIAATTIDEALASRRKVLVRYGPFRQRLRFASLLSPTNSVRFGNQEERIRLLLYFHSLLTVAGTVDLDGQKHVSLWIPNMMFASTYLKRVLPALSDAVVELIGAVRRPTAVAWQNSLQHLVDNQAGPITSQQLFRENTLQAVINDAISKTSELCNAGVSTTAEHVVSHGTKRSTSERGQSFVPRAGKDPNIGGADLVLTTADGSSAVHLGLKVLSRSRVASRAVRGMPHRLLYRFLSPPQSGLDRGHVPEDVLLAAEIAPGYKVKLFRRGATAVSSKERFLVVEDLLNSTCTTAAENAAGLRHLYENLRSFAVLMVGYRFIVREVHVRPHT